VARIYLSPPHATGQELALVEDAFASNWLAPVGPHVDAFERDVADLVGVSHAVALSSGTAALHLAVKLLGIGPGDEVLCSTLTFSAAANAIVYEGATPVFIDADHASWTMDPVLLEEELSGSGRLPRAVIVTDLFGQAADYAAILRICGRYGVPVIEDAAEALGAVCHGRMAGSFGRCGILSFNGNKIITTSGGGMLVSDEAEAIARAKFLASQARDPAPHYEHSVIGYNYRLSNVLAAIGRAQLDALPARVAARRRNFECYASLLGDLPGVEFMPEAPYGRATRWLTCLTIDPERFGADRDSVRLALDAEDIEARPLWKPMHLQPVFRHCRVRGGRVSEVLFERGLCLPSGSNLTAADLERVAAIVEAQHPSRRPVDRPATPLRSDPSRIAPAGPRHRQVAGTATDMQQIEHGLFRRGPLRLDHALIERFLTGKRVMVTGAGGSIGAELARRVLRHAPDVLLLVDRSEAALFAAEMELRPAAAATLVKACLADVGDETRIRQICRDDRPQIVLHTAANKHVPLMEENAAEAIKNNVLATESLGMVAAGNGVESFILISTDKAVRPSSVMGASKRVAELLVQDLDRRFPATRYVAVRFGNVIGSTGSVLPIFREQIARGGPVTVTHPEATRYFMTLGEASELVLEAGAIGRGGEILVLDMGEPVRILDLAEQMIGLAGLRPYHDIPIVFIGLRAGEKLHEDLDPGITQDAGGPHSKIIRGRLPARPSGEIREAVDRLAALARDGDGDAIREYLGAWLPDATLGLGTRERGQGTR
jgi:pyridoxal phosphate-dependent aminotransferase EpsN